MPARRRILLVDDDREIVRGVGIRLKAAGYEVLAAYDGEAGLQATREHLPDAIVLDVQMPVMDGLAMLGELRRDEQTQAIPVIVLSANAAAKGRSQAFELGAQYVLEKPYDARSLIEAIESAIEQAATSVPAQ